jgi:O-antigen/teichoic acid export membrane protein
MGIEAYALVTFYAFLSAFLSVLDLGLSSTVTREVARLFRGPEGGRRLLRSTIFTYECVFLLLGAAGGALVAFSANLLANRWLHVSPEWHERAVTSIVLMGVAFFAQWPTSIYQAALYGTERQVLANALAIAGAIMRGLAAIFVLRFVSHSPAAFFASQGGVALLQTIAARVVLSHVVRPDSGNAKVSFEWAVISANWHFSGGMFLTSLLGFILGQADKLVLSRVLSLEDLGYYGLASALASGLYNVGSSVYMAVFPRFVQLVERNSAEQLARVYHLASQVVAAVVLPAAMLAIVQPVAVLEAWTGQNKTATLAAPVLGPLALGTALNVLMTMPSAAQLAHKWTSLNVLTNAALAVVILPMTYLFTQAFGARGAAYAWVLLNFAYLVAYVPLMHKRILTSEMPHWYRNLLFQAAAAALPLIAMKALAQPHVAGRWQALAWIAFNAALSLGFALTAATALRTHAWAWLKQIALIDHH